MKQCVLPLFVLCAPAAVHGYGFASKLSTHEVVAFDEVSGQMVYGGAAFIAAESGGLNQPHGIMHRGADILVSSFGTDSVKRFDPFNGQYMGDLLTTAQGIDNPVQMKIGPDRRLYLSSQGNHRILRFEFETGAAVDAQPFIAGGQLNGPSGFDWSPDKSVLYVAGRYSGNVLAYNAQTGTPLTTGHVFASGLGAGSTFGLTVAPQGDVFVATNNQVRRYSSAGALLATLTISSIGLELAPDSNGVLAASNGTVRRINLSDNSVTGSLLSPAPGGINFFRWPVPIIAGGGRPLTVESGGQRFLAIQFGVPKFALGQSRMQFSTDLFQWTNAVVYSPLGTGVRRESPALTVQHALVDYGDWVLVTERDAEPVGAQTRRFFSMAHLR